MGLLAGMILSGMFAISVLGDLSAASPAFYLPLIASIFSASDSCSTPGEPRRRSSRLRLIAGKGFATMNVLNVFYGSATLGFGALVPLYAENRYHIHIANAGTLLFPTRSA